MPGGRPLGSKDKLPAILKDMILQALDDAGGVGYLVEQARENPGPFLALLGKILPMQVTGSNGGPIAITVETGIPIPIPMAADDHG